MGIWRSISNIWTKYPVRVIIAERRGDSRRWDFDWGRRIKKGGKEFYDLKFRNEEFEPPAGDKLEMTKKAKSILFLYSPQDGQYNHFNLETAPDIRIIDKEVDFWRTVAKREKDKKYAKEQGFLEKYMPFIMVGIVAAMLVFIVIYLGDKLDAMTRVSAGAIENGNKILQKLTEVISQSPAFE